MPYCSSCGTEHGSDAQFCGSCGALLGATPIAGELIPRDVGELLGETFSVYGRNFWPFATIVALAQIPNLVGMLISIPTFSLLLTVASIILGILAYGAVTYGAAAQYLGDGINIGECYGRAWGRVLSLIIGTLLIGIVLSFLGLLSLILIGIPLFFYVLATYYFFPQAIILERKGGIAALARSRELVRGNWWRLFAIGVLFILVSFAIGIALLILVAIVSFFSQPLGGIFSAGVSIIVTPILVIGATISYLDLRVRKEGYTLDVMAKELAIQEEGD